MALIAYFGWKRTRYFGNTAPLLIAALLLILALGAPNFPGQGFHLTMLVFLFVFVSGVFADLLETQQSSLVTAGLCGLLSASAIWNLSQLWRVLCKRRSSIHRVVLGRPSQISRVKITADNIGKDQP